MGRVAIGILTLIAELELERIKEGWTTAVSQAVARGVHISARPPTGYRRDEGGRLLRDEPAATVVAEVFRRRALGSSWAELARFLEEQQVYPPTGNKQWSKVGVTGLVRNPVDLGQARSGSVVNDAAHEPIVTRGRVRCGAGGEEVAVRGARWIGRVTGDVGRLGSLCWLRPYAEDHREHEEVDGGGVRGLLLHRPLREWIV